MRCKKKQEIIGLKTDVTNAVFFKLFTYSNYSFGLIDLAMKLLSVSGILWRDVEKIASFQS